MSKSTAGEAPFRIALIGNPNSGKTSIFNRLTGLQQKTGNFPGVTVELHAGTLQLPGRGEALLVDLPGTYSLYPNSLDERLVVQTLCNPAHPLYPDAIIYVADYTRLEKHLLLFSQIKDVGIPCVLLLNMADLATDTDPQRETERLAKSLQTPTLLVSSLTGKGFDEVDDVLGELLHKDAQQSSPLASHFSMSRLEQDITQALAVPFPKLTDYQRLLLAHHYEWFDFLDTADKQSVAAVVKQHRFESIPLQVEETMARYRYFTPLVKKAVQHKYENPLLNKLDGILTNRFLGPILFFVLMLLVFQAIFTWAEWPMGWIEGGFAKLNEGIIALAGEHWWSKLITDGIMTGLAGVLVFIPQIAILFFLITLLEEVGYMARAAYMFDRFMRFFGLNGRSMIALISSGACAIPAIMSTRTISNRKERLITILVSPFISCSARLPVYVVLVAFVVPSGNWYGISWQALAFTGLYLLGILAALLSALLLKWWLPNNESSYLMLELPRYRPPVWRNVGLVVWDKVKHFVTEAGRIIMVIALILWALTNYGPKGKMQIAVETATRDAQAQSFGSEETQALVDAYRLEQSYAGHLGRYMEPLIAPLGFDWKMGIAIITSFAAREVFTGTLAVIYSAGAEADESRLKDRLLKERNPRTGELSYNPATSVSLLLFYVFAMMCMSTLAVVRRETGSWKWPLLQFGFMTALAYLSAFAAYQLLS